MTVLRLRAVRCGCLGMDTVVSNVARLRARENRIAGACGEEIPCRSQLREPDNIHKEIRDHSSRALPRTCDLSGRTAAEGEIPFGPPRR